jgi:hypothetical protein
VTIEHPPGWWLASDGHWYPPHTRPAGAAGQSPTARTNQKENGLVGWWRERQEGRAQHRRRDAMQRWETVRDDLERALEAIQSFHGWTPAELSAPVPIALKRGERLYGVFDGVALIETRRQPGQYRGGYGGASYRLTSRLRVHGGGSRGTYVPGPEIPTPIDNGVASITDRRVVFQGAKQSREWAFTKLIGYQHATGSPWTAIQVSNRQKTSGILYDQQCSDDFRWRLDLAVADANGTRNDLASRVQSQLAAHLASKPASYIEQA